MSPRAKAGPTLFAAAGLDKDAPRPLADRLRPQKLDEVVGQDHLLGADGALTRMLATRSLGSLVFWGPPGTGKTTVARLLAQATDLHFEQISAIFTGVADLKKVFEEARRRRELGQGTLLFVDEIHRFNRAQQDQFPAGDGRRHHRAGRRHHREPVVRTQRAAVVARARAGVQIARCRRRSRNCSRAPNRSRASKLPLDDEARFALVRMADGDGRAALTLAEEVWRAARKDEVFGAAQVAGHRAAPRADLRQGAGRPLQSDLRAAQVGARLRSRRRALLSLPHARRRRAAALHRAPRGAHGDRGHWACRSAGAGDRQCRQGRLRFPRQPGRRTGHRRSRALYGDRAEIERGLCRLRRRHARRQAGAARCCRPSTSSTRRPS